jgi:3-phosphoshikimate 1-carboxyvinyltransferase
LIGALRSEDTDVFLAALTQLGVGVQVDGQTMTVRSRGGGPPNDHAHINVQLSGTSARFLAPYLGLGVGRYVLDGNVRMRQRPMGELVAGLRAMGVEVHGGPGLPLELISCGHLDGGTISVTAEATSQHLSGLLMVAPYADNDVVLSLTGPMVSRSYVHMTVGLMAAFGINVEVRDDALQVSTGQRYRAQAFAVEPDASAACYFWAAATLCGGVVATPGLLSRTSLQGDVAFLDVLTAMGATVREGPHGIIVQGPADRHLHAVDVDMNDISDQVPTFAALALFADGPSTVRHVAHIRGKESDRIAAVATEVARLGAAVEERADGLVIGPLAGSSPGAVVQTYGDHRMAMAFSLVGLRHSGIGIADPECVSKTFPDFFEVLEAMTHGRLPSACADQ